MSWQAHYSCKYMTKPLLKLLSLAEELLFSFPLPSEVVRKYEDLRRVAFSKVNLVSNAAPLWKLQRQAHIPSVLASATETRAAQTDLQSCSTAEPLREEAFLELQATSAARVRYLELLDVLETTYALLSKQQVQMNGCLLMQVQVGAKLYSAAGKNDQMLEGLLQVQAHSEQLAVAREPRPNTEEEEAEHTATLQECRRVLNAYESALEELTLQMSTAQRRIEEGVQIYMAMLEASNEEASRMELERTAQLQEELHDKETLASRVQALNQELLTKEQQFKSTRKTLKKQLKSKMQEKLQNQAQQHILELQSLDSGKLDLVRSVSAADDTVSSLKAEYAVQLEKVRTGYQSQLQAVAEELAAARKAHTQEHLSLTEQLEGEIRARARELADAQAEIALLQRNQTVAPPQVAHKAAQASPPQQERQDPDAQRLLSALEDRLTHHYDRFAPHEKTWQQSLAQRKEGLLAQWFGLTERIEVVLRADFAVEFGERKQRDALWLADQMAHLARENQELLFHLRTSGRKPPRQEAAQQLRQKVSADMQQTAAVLQEFESARSSLLSKLKV